MAHERREAHRNLDRELEGAGQREYATPLANIVEAAYLLRSLPHTEQIEQIARYVHRVYIQLDQMNPISSVHRANSRQSQHACSMPQQLEGSQTRGAGVELATTGQLPIVRRKTSGNTSTPTATRVPSSQISNSNARCKCTVHQTTRMAFPCLHVGSD